MRFRETIGAKPLNLTKTAFGKFGFIAALLHAGDHLLAKTADLAMFFIRCHGAAQLIRLIAGKASSDDGNLHRLFLK